MELKLTTVGALAYEERTGRDILETLGDIASAAQQGRTPKLTQLIDVFCAMGKDYDAQTFDDWEAPLQEKIVAITNAAKEYIVGKNAKHVSVSSSKGATHTGSNHKK